MHKGTNNKEKKKQIVIGETRPDNNDQSEIFSSDLYIVAGCRIYVGQRSGARIVFRLNARNLDISAGAIETQNSEWMVTISSYEHNLWSFQY